MSGSQWTTAVGVLSMGVLCALSGIVATLALVDQAPVVAPEGDLSLRLDRLHDEVSRMHALLRLEPGRRTRAREPESTRVAHSSERDTADEKVSSQAPWTTAEPSRIHPAVNAAAVATLSDWAGESDTRRRWLFTGQEDALASFGTPDRVVASSAYEAWCYFTAMRGDAVVEEQQLRFAHGRLIDVQRVRLPRPLRR